MATQTQTGRFRPPISHVFYDSTAAGTGRRIDEPHRDGLWRRTSGAEPPPASPHHAPAGNAAAGDATAGEATANNQLPSPLLQAHADDLVHNLQSWAAVLDRRESELNAGIARQENRERSFRLWAQTQQQQLLQLEREANRLREELKQQARRLALAAQEAAVHSPR